MLPTDTQCGSHVLIGAMSTGPRKAQAVSLPAQAHLDFSLHSVAIARARAGSGEYSIVAGGGGIVSAVSTLSPRTFRRRQSHGNDSMGASPRRSRSGSMVVGAGPVEVAGCEIPEQTNWVYLYIGVL